MGGVELGRVLDSNQDEFSPQDEDDEGEDASVEDAPGIPSDMENSGNVGLAQVIVFFTRLLSFIYPAVQTIGRLGHLQNEEEHVADDSMRKPYLDLGLWKGYWIIFGLVSVIESVLVVHLYWFLFLPLQVAKIAFLGKCVFPNAKLSGDIYLEIAKLAHEARDMFKQQTNLDQEMEDFPKQDSNQASSSQTSSDEDDDDDESDYGDVSYSDEISEDASSFKTSSVSVPSSSNLRQRKSSSRSNKSSSRHHHAHSSSDEDIRSHRPTKKDVLVLD